MTTPLAGQGNRVTLAGPFSPYVTLKRLDAYSDADLQRLDRLLSVLAVATDAELRARDMAAKGDGDAVDHHHKLRDYALGTCACVVNWQ